jgi:hypothetical protein
MCQPCYKKWLAATPVEARPRTARFGRGRYTEPSTCHPDQPQRAKGLCAACYLKQYRSTNIVALKLKSKGSHLLSKYGITPEQRADIYQAQGGACAICERALEEFGKQTHVDHCHTTGTVRGILCNTCNWFLSRIDADPAIVERIKTHRSKSWNKADLAA